MNMLVRISHTFANLSIRSKLIWQSWGHHMDPLTPHKKGGIQLSFILSLPWAANLQKKKYSFKSLLSGCLTFHTKWCLVSTWQRQIFCIPSPVLISPAIINKFKFPIPCQTDVLRNNENPSTTSFLSLFSHQLVVSLHSLQHLTELAWFSIESLAWWAYFLRHGRVKLGIYDEKRREANIRSTHYILSEENPSGRRRLR